MKKRERLSCPQCFDCSCEDIKEKKIEYYEDLRHKLRETDSIEEKKKEGKIKPRWIELDIDKDTGISSTQKRLLEMSNNSCVYCGKRLLDDMEVDHYLPTAKFPYLAYCWDNMLPACSTCNMRIKKAYTPEAIKGKKIIEKILEGKYPHDYLYDKDYILNVLLKDKRLIEPTFDTIEDHLDFDPDKASYTHKTGIGLETLNKFFRRREFDKHLWGLRNLVKELVSIGAELELIKIHIETFGYEYYYMEFYEYFRNEKASGRPLL